VCGASFLKDGRAVLLSSFDRAFSRAGGGLELSPVFTRPLLDERVKFFRLDQQALNPVDDSTDYALIKTPADAYVKVGAILSPVLQSDEELILNRMLGGSPLLLFQLFVLEEDFKHPVKSMAMNAAQPLEVFRLQVFDLFVGHELLYLNLLRFY
jgi:hypothetical protein